MRTGTVSLPGGYLGTELLGENLGVEAWKALQPDSSVYVFWKGSPRSGFGTEILALVREAEALGELSDGGLVKPILDSTRDEHPHLVFPWIKGQSYGSRPPIYKSSQILGVLRETAQILQKVHQKGWIHGDIRPENLFWSLDGIKLIDFGLCKRIGEIAELPPNHSPEFLAPETQKIGYAWQPEADWYALGKTATRWLGGAGVNRFYPKESGNGAERESRKKAGAIAPPPGFWPWMAEWTNETPANRLKASRIINGLLEWEVKWLSLGD